MSSMAPANSPRNQRSATSYYTRHQEARQQYQRNYNSVKRLGRRKIGQREHAVEESMRRRERTGQRGRYTTAWAHRQHNVDAARTLTMEIEEGDLSTRLVDMENSAMEGHGDNWLPVFLDAVNALIREVEAVACEAVNQHNTDEGDAAKRQEQLHGIRRILAGLHQSKEFAEQGFQAGGAAAEDKAWIWQGRSVNRTKFYSVYRW
ncbi:hypothetical protein BV25DRAFT_1918614 [Artomyces pyxidatus]|uniref:Uncharacterized protein n=1 Tax=Artomyces pyxidatus TaxID=48021 RepID=A0ACB8ST42_9AGAM|nr:hypothetical protein BV25DRAFT_1918614 [Artomyces pyxidatus]